jgi:hypothetical protein
MDASDAAMPKSDTPAMGVVAGAGGVMREGPIELDCRSKSIFVSTPIKILSYQPQARGSICAAETQ